MIKVNFLLLIFLFMERFHLISNAGLSLPKSLEKEFTAVVDLVAVVKSLERRLFSGLSNSAKI